MNKNYTDVLIGLLTGLAANILGIFLWWIFFSDTDFSQMFVIAYQKDLLGAIIGLGALLNFLPFFFFLKKQYPSRARGVLLATFLAAFVILILKFV